MTPKTILVMDDSPIVLEAVAAVLEANGYRVKTAANIQELETSRAEGEPDLFVFDVQMPEAFGDDVGELLRSKRRVTTPMLLFSSMDEALLAQRVRDAGLQGYVSKSAGVGALLLRVGELLGSEGT